MAEKVEKPAIVVLGASGQIGLFAVPRLVAAGYDVIALSRTGQPADFPDLASVSWLSPEKLTNGRQAALMLSAGPLNLVSGLLQQQPEVKGLVAFSTTSLLAKADSRDPAERDQVRDIARSEARIADICGSRGIACCLLRPTLVYGCGMDSNVSLLARLIRKMPWLPVAGSASGLRQPVHADDLAAAAVTALAELDRLPAELILCGGSTLSYREMLRRIADANGLKLRILPLPLTFLSGLLGVLGWLPGLREVRPEMLRRQGQDLVFDDAPARALLGYRPRSFCPEDQDFRRPDRVFLVRLADASN